MDTTKLLMVNGAYHFATLSTLTFVNYFIGNKVFNIKPTNVGDLTVNLLVAAMEQDLLINNDIIPVAITPHFMRQFIDEDERGKKVEQ
jgi:hypothetical protein